MEDTTIAAVSLRSRPAEPASNLQRHVAWLEKAREAGASCCLFPEMSVTGFCQNCKLFFAASEPVCGSSTTKMIELARQYDLSIGFGLATRNERDLVSNSYLFVSPDGYLGKYSKTHIPIFEYSLATPGDEFTVVNLGPLRAGVNICFDNWFAECSRLSFLQGAELIVAPFWMSWGPETIQTEPEKAHNNWKKLAMINFPAVAWQNGVYHLTINSCGGVHEKETHYDGPPIILLFNPQGELEQESDPSSTEEQMLIHTLQAQKLYDRRSEELFHPKYRRPGIYSDLTKGLNE